MSGGSDNVQSEANVDAFLVADENRGDVAAGEFDGLVTILVRGRKKVWIPTRPIWASLAVQK